MITARRATTLGSTVVAAVAVYNLEDELLGLSRRLTGADQVHRSQTVHALVLGDNVNVAATALLQVANRFTSASNDETNGPIRHHDLHAVFAVLGNWGIWNVGRRTTTTGSLVHAGTSKGAHATILNDSVDL